LPLIEISSPQRLFRIHDLSRDPVWFGPQEHAGPLHRFDDPHGEYRTLYAGLTEACAFAERFLRNAPARVLSETSVRAFGLAVLQLARPLRVVELKGSGLARAGVTSAIVSGLYESSQAFAREIWEHASSADGILYRARHDDDQIAVAVFDRARDAIHLDAGRSQPLIQDRRRLGELLSRYGLGLVP
jgi:hypothetical protein